MDSKNPAVDTYFADGCGRCPLGGTPECKVHRWDKELEALRRIVLDTGLNEERKWGVPCYTFQGNNVAVISAFNENCVVSFFKGLLLQDTEGLLESPGENSQSVKLFRFTDLKSILQLESVIKAYTYEAIEIEKAGLKVDFPAKDELLYPEELSKMLAENSDLHAAFEALTPGRKRGYVLHFTSAKQAPTRIARIEKAIPKIMEGKGFHDR